MIDSAAGLAGGDTKDYEYADRDAGRFAGTFTQRLASPSQEGGGGSLAITNLSC